MGLEPDTRVDFAKLNAAERTALNLLAQGHTAKSIANLTDRSIGAVNERLREARRKTGVGSSRELARLFAAQENRDELIGVAPAADTASKPTTPAAIGRRWKGATLMSLAFAGAFAVAIFVAQPAPLVSQSATASDAGKLDPTSWNSDYWHRRVADEQRDSQWAPAAEDALRARMAQVPDLDTGDHPLKIHCATTACEVTGTLSGDDKRQSAMLSDVQTAAFKPVPGGPALTNVGFQVVVNRGQAPGFTIQFRRD
jgi:DNA-binding CsgD family transcriptional regulator